MFDGVFSPLKITNVKGAIVSGVEIPNSQLYEFVIPTGGAQILNFNKAQGIDFSTINQGQKIVGVRAYCATSITRGPSGTTVIDEADLRTVFVTLAELRGNGQFVDKLPLQDIEPSLSPGYPIGIRPFHIDTTNSFFTFGNPAGLTPGEVIVLQFFYEDPK